MYELVVAGDGGGVDVYGGYADMEAAEEAGRGMEMALGNQIRWYGVRPQKEGSAR